MTLRDLALYLIGHRGAIQRLAGTRHALWVGALLVLTGGVARNYDGAWLPGQWPVLTHGLAVAAINATILYTLVFLLFARREMPNPRYGRGWIAFLGLFWLTAPMAWLYAVPYEHFLTPVEAVGANAWTLAGVSAWRVLLMTRVISVLWGASPLRTWFVVMVFADAVVLAAAALSPMPVIDVMGGLQRAPEEEAAADLNFALLFFAVLSAPVWLIGAIIAGVRLSGAWRVTPAKAGVSPAVYLALAVVFSAMGVLLARFQPHQYRRHEATQLLLTEPGAGMAYMSRFERWDFPPVWNPPPRDDHGETKPAIHAIRAALRDGAALRPWVRELFLDKSWRFRIEGWGRLPAIGDVPSWRAGRALPEKPSPQMVEVVRFHVEHDERLSTEQREELRGWLDRE